MPGKRNPRKIGIGDYPTFPADKAREQAQTMLQAIKRGDDPAAERAAKKALPVWEDLVAAFRAKHLPKKNRRPPRDTTVSSTAFSRPRSRASALPTSPQR